MLAKAFGKPMTLTAIRHNFSSTIDNNLPVRKLKLISDSMAHSVGQQKLYKWDETADRNEIVTPE